MISGTMKVPATLVGWLTIQGSLDFDYGDYDDWYVDDYRDDEYRYSEHEGEDTKEEDCYVEETKLLSKK